MKKTALLLAAALCLAVLCACSSGSGQPSSDRQPPAGSSSAAQVTVRPSHFSPETQQVLELFEEELVFFDVDLGEGALFHKISLWVFRDGAWQEEGRTFGESALLPGQIAIRLTETSYDLYILEESGHTKYGWPVLETDLENTSIRQSYRLSRETAVQLGEELPLWVKVGSGDSSARTADLPADFRAFPCTAGVAVTLTVSDQPLG